MRYLPKTIVATPDIETLHTQLGYFGLVGYLDLDAPMKVSSSGSKCQNFSGSLPMLGGWH